MASPAALAARAQWQPHLLGTCPASVCPGREPGPGRGRTGTHGGVNETRTKETDRKQLLEHRCKLADSPQSGRPGLRFWSSICPSGARNTAHNSSLGGRLDSCRGSRCYEWSRLPQGLGGGGPRVAQGLKGTMARPGPTVAEAGAAADGEGWGTGAKLGTKGPFSRPAGGCLHRCGSGRAAVPWAGGRGAALLLAAPGTAGNAGGQRQGWALLSGGHSPPCFQSPRNPPSSG